MSPIEPDIDYERYYSYHNRLASYMRWPLNWEMDNEKPTPEALARAGFLYYAEPPCLSDNVICPFCLIFVDEWDPNDDPMHEHRGRSPDCPYVNRYLPVGKVHDKQEPCPEQDTSRRDDKAPGKGNQNPPSSYKPQKHQETLASSLRQTKPSNNRADAPLAKAKELGPKENKRRKNDGE